MTTTTMKDATRLHPEASSTGQGPVVLATKPLGGTDTPLAVARWLAQREDRELHVVSVLEHNEFMAVTAGVPMLPPQYYQEEKRIVAERLHEILDATVRTRVDVIEGQSARTIVELAHDRDARVIVIGTGKHDSVGRFLYGERAMQIVRLSDRPVLVVPESSSDAPVRHAVVAVDFSVASLRAAQSLLPMLPRGARVTLLHVRADVGVRRTQTTAGLPACDELFRRFIKLLQPGPDVTVETKVLWGDTLTLVEEFVRAREAGLLACGRRRNHTLKERLFVGSVSAGLIRRASCPVLVVPEPDDAAAERIDVSLSGLQSWERYLWPTRLAEFEERNRDRRVRLGIDGGAGGGAFVAQNYQLRAIDYDSIGDRMNIVLGDTSTEMNLLSARYADLRTIQLHTDAEGDDIRLEFRWGHGTGTITVAASQLP